MRSQDGSWEFRGVFSRTGGLLPAGAPSKKNGSANPPDLGGVGIEFGHEALEMNDGRGERSVCLSHE